jgi:hypothetical protein
MEHNNVLFFSELDVFWKKKKRRITIHRTLWKQWPGKPVS